MDTNLAIVIPAYKAEFLSGTLSSLANQTDKRFNVYIGDDCSPANLENIVAPFLDKMSINYRRFPHNAGKNDLTGHWTRCLEMMNGEEFFCMFSDDDIMEPECISSLYKTIETYPQYDVYHFDINIIGSDNSLKCECPAFPPVISAEEFFEKLYNQTIDARMPEFVFRTEHFMESGGFVPFKKAYRSDNASVMASASGKGIRTINGKNAKVLWRDSGVNISSSKDKSLINDMSDANIAFFNWVHSYFRIRRLKYPLGLKTECRYILDMLMQLYPEYSIHTMKKSMRQYNPQNFIYKSYINIKFNSRLKKLPK